VEGVVAFELVMTLALFNMSVGSAA